jgi:predicted MPP superfamily phosphohydrolase
VAGAPQKNRFETVHLDPKKGFITRFVHLIKRFCEWKRRAKHDNYSDMSLFLFIYFSIYGGLHLYVYLKARAALTPGFGVGVALACFMVAMVMAPIGVRLFERNGLHLAARLCAYVGYTWMGLVFLFFCLGVCQDLFNLLMRLLALLPGSNTDRLVWTGKKAFITLAVITLSIGIWSSFRAWDIRLDRISIQSSKLPAQFSGLAIAQISDLHLGMMVGEKRLERIIDIVRKAKPDVVVCTGDLVDAQMDKLDHLATMLAELKPPLGKFAITGNHEFYTGVAQSKHFLQAAGFTVLRNERYRLDNLVTIVGVDDPTADRMETGQEAVDQKETRLLAGSVPEEYILLLKHRPVVLEESQGRFDLQLSGHTHGGQIFPFSLVTGLYYPRQNGLHRLEKGSILYVSRGTGTWGPPMRFLAPPQVTLIELINTE